jgi:elongator complex protein 3
VRKYYSNLGYVLDGPYMSKVLNRDQEEEEEEEE